MWIDNPASLNVQVSGRRYVLILIYSDHCAVENEQDLV